MFLVTECQCPFQVGEEVRVDQHGAVVGVFEHVRQLLGRHPHVEGVQYPPGAGDPEVRLEVTGAVPGQRGTRDGGRADLRRRRRGRRLASGLAREER